MKNYIWDLDGTLLNSYDVITSSLVILTKRYNIEEPYDSIYKQVKQTSVSNYLNKMETITGIKASSLKDEYSLITDSKKYEITLEKNAKEVLEALNKSGKQNFVFTHRGATTNPVLENLDIKKYFVEIVSSVDGFPKKPDPSAINYLVDKYHLSKEETCYVGDRNLDMECARNAGITTILYKEENSYVIPDGKEDFIIDNLNKVLDL